MPTFTRDDVQRLARLARLELTEEETETFTRQLGDVLEFIRQIQSVEAGSPTREATASLSPPALRDDIVYPSLDRTEVLAEAPDADTAMGLFKVPRVLNG